MCFYGLLFSIIKGNLRIEASEKNFTTLSGARENTRIYYYQYVFSRGIVENQ